MGLKEFYKQQDKLQPEQPQHHLEATKMRSLCKTFTWRVTASLDTAAIAWFLTGNLHMAASIATLEVATKLVWYYVHERIWNRIELGHEET